MSEFPNDEDGQVLAQLAAQGVDLTKPLEIDFTIDAPDEAAANAIGTGVGAQGYEVEVVYDEGEMDDDEDLDPEEFGPSWTVYAKITMVPEYDRIVQIQVDLNAIAVEHEGQCDGWGVMLG